MSEEQKRKLQSQLWGICNYLRGKMSGDEYRDYTLGFIFFKFLSERLYAIAQNALEAVIGLLSNLFFGTGIPAAILVFKKCREDSENILFIDAIYSC